MLITASLGMAGQSIIDPSCLWTVADFVEFKSKGYWKTFARSGCWNHEQWSEIILGDRWENPKRAKLWRQKIWQCVDKKMMIGMVNRCWFREFNMNRLNIAEIWVIWACLLKIFFIFIVFYRAATFYIYIQWLTIIWFLT